MLLIDVTVRIHSSRVGIALAIGSGVLIGCSFVFKKKGLLASQGENLGEGVAYLKNVCVCLSGLGDYAWCLTDTRHAVAGMVDRHDYDDPRRAMQLRSLCVRCCNRRRMSIN